MALLINRTDIAVFRQISKSTLDDVINMHITDAQFVDVQDLLGDDFFNALIRDPNTTEHLALLNAGDYTFGATTFTNVGLKAVIVHYTYSRYVLDGSAIDTPFSFVEKLNEDTSRPVNFLQKKSISKSNQQTAFRYWENVKIFLDRNKEDYPLWRNGTCDNIPQFRINQIGGEQDINFNHIHHGNHIKRC